MIYLNGQIGAVYMNGRYHSEVYLGSVLVWQNVKKIPGEAYAQLAFANTAEGVSAVLLPGDAAEELAMTANVTAEAHGMADGSSEELLTLLTAAAAEGAVADGAEGAAAAEMVVGSAIQPETLTVSDGHGTGQLAAETQTRPEVLTLAEAPASAGLMLKHKAVGTAYLPWEYPVLLDGVLSITQAWNVVYAKNQHILEVI